MIKFIREKFRGAIERKVRKLQRELQEIIELEHRLECRRKKVQAQLNLLGILKVKEYRKRDKLERRK